MPLLLLKLLGIRAWLKRAGGAVLGAALRYPWQAALVAALCLSAWLWRGWNQAEVRADHWQAAHAEQQAAVLAAQAEAAAAQAAADAREFSFKTDLAETSHALSIKAAADARDAVAAFARDHPVRVCRAAAGGAPGGAAGPGLPGDPGPVPGENPASDMVAIPRSDLDAIAGKAVQDSVKTEFFNAAVKAGWAVPQSQVPAALPDVGF